MHLPSGISIVSLKDMPECRLELIDYVARNWSSVLGPFSAVIDQVITSRERLPKCFLLLSDNRIIIGFYQLVEQELIERKDLSPWITCVFIDERARGQRLSSHLLEHGRRVAGDLGYAKAYLATDHIQFYEKFGFREIGLDKFVWGRPTKIYEHDTIR